MLKKTITFEDYSEPPQEVTQSFYFNFTKLEVIEKLEVEDLEGTIKKLTETNNGPEAYELFKKLILSAYGEKNEHGGFDKEDANGRPLYKKFEASPACSELIIEFLQDPMQGAAFIEACLPAKMVKEAKEAQKNNPSKQQIAEMVQEAARRQENPETAVAPTAPQEQPEELLTTAEPAREMKFEDYTEDQLLEMSDEQFASLVPVHSPKDMTQQMLLIAFKRKSSK